MLTSPIRQPALRLAFLIPIVLAAPARAAVPTNFVDEVMVSGYSQPNGFAFLPDGRQLVIEQRTGNVRMGVNGVASAAILTVPLLSSTANERGLLAIAIDPGWPTRPYVYLFYTRTGSLLRLVRYTASGDLDAPASSNLSLASPYLLIDDIQDLATNHNGGTLRFGPDGNLYLSLGEDANQCSAQDPSTLRGVVMRLDVSGLPPGAGGPATRAELTPPDNPFVGSANANTRLVWAYGLRNPFRYGIDPVSGRLYLGDVGENDWEEVDEIEAGDNLGWPHIEGFVNRSAGCQPPPGFSPRAPIAVYSHADGIAIMGAGMYRPRAGGASNWPQEYWGDVFYADYYSGIVRRLHWNGASWVPEAAPGQPNGDDWATSFSNPVDFAIGPDGSWWYCAQGSGSIRRLRWTGTAVVAEPPTASAALTAVSPFTAGTDISFSLGRGGSARLAIFDVHGRRVRTLFDGPLGSGARRMRWDGLADDGRAVSSGMYLVVLEHPEGRAVARALRLR